MINKQSIYITLQGDIVGIAKTSCPAGTTQYHHAAWWASTVNRNPDIEVAGPYNTRRELVSALRRDKAEGRY